MRKNTKLLNETKRSALVHRQYDERYPVVARKLKTEINEMTDIFEIEHVGSTAVPGSSGKGIIDLMALYPEGSLEQTKDFLLSIGFSRQGDDFTYNWPDNRPMYLGNYEFDGDVFPVYIHVLKKDSAEVHRFRLFRERLKENSALLKEYCDIKEALISEGTVNSDEYTRRKKPIIRKILEENS